MDWRLRAHRRKLFHEPGQAHELTFTCYRRFRLLGSERTCQWLADSINEARTKFDLELWAYVFMPDHAHLLIHPQSGFELDAILKASKEPVGRKAVKYLQANAPEWLPRITVRRGQREERRFWQSGGGYDRNVLEPKTVLSMIEYLHLNPVRKGLVARAADWKWSSAAWYEGASPNTLSPDRIRVEHLLA